MSIPKQDGAFLLRLEQPLTKDNAAAHAEAIANALEEVTNGSALRLVTPSPEGPDATGLAVLLATAKECRTRSVELHLRLPKELAELAEDLRLAKHAVLEITEGAP
jgi:ABC-type transporter Mla MlaB component